jgi:hypothetical protein
MQAYLLPTIRPRIATKWTQIEKNLLQLQKLFTGWINISPVSQGCPLVPSSPNIGKGASKGGQAAGGNQELCPEAG